MSFSSIPFLLRSNTSWAAPTDRSNADRTHKMQQPQKLSSSPTSTQQCKPTLPIAIPRRKTACPPPSSPVRLQPSPELVFNFDFSVSPCSFQGHGKILTRTRTEEWVQHAPFLQQRGRVNILLAHQCHQQQNVMYVGARHAEKPRPEELLLYTHQAYSANVDNEKDSLDEAPDREPGGTSPTSSVCSSIVFATPSCSIPDPASLDCVRGRQSSSPRLTSAFQRSITSASEQTTSPCSTPISPLSPIVFHPPTPVSPPQARAHRRVLSAIFLRNSANANLLRTPAAPVVSFKVAQADRSAPNTGPRTGTTTFPRGRSPYPGPGQRARRTSSVGSCRAPTVVGAGWALLASGSTSRSSLVLSNEELESSLEKPTNRENVDESNKSKESACERGRLRERTRERGIAMLRAPTVHM